MSGSPVWRGSLATPGAVQFLQVKHGPFGGSRSGRRARIADSDTSPSDSCHCQRTTPLVPIDYMPIAKMRLLAYFRLNSHLSSIISPSSFEIPVEQVARVQSGVISGSTSLSSARLSSFGFSGTIAHCLLVPYRPPPTRLTVSVALSLFRRAVDAPVEIRVFPARRRDDATATTLLTVVRVSGTIRDHLINGTVIFPGVGYLEIAA